MKRILIVCSHFFDDSDANAICVRNLLKAATFDKDVYVITEDPPVNKNGLAADDFPNVSFYYVKKSFYETISNQSDSKFRRMVHSLFSFFRRLVNIIVYPNVSPFRTKKVLRLAKKIIMDKRIEFYLATYRPFESIMCGIKLRKSFKELKLVAYHFDNLDNYSFKNNLISHFLSKRIARAFKKEMKAFNKIYVTYSSSLNGTNVIQIGLPVYKRNDCLPFDYSFDPNYINIVYIGTLNNKNRDPTFALSLIETYNKNNEKKALLHIWGKITKDLSFLFKKYEGIVKNNGIIDNKYTQFIYEKCDYVLNIGNKITLDMIPSKIFQVFASGKPILSFNNQNDKSLVYLREYPNSVLIPYDDNEKAYSILAKALKEKNINLCSFKDNSWTMFKPDVIAKELFNED